MNKLIALLVALALLVAPIAVAETMDFSNVPDESVLEFYVLLNRELKKRDLFAQAFDRVAHSDFGNNELVEMYNAFENELVSKGLVAAPSGTYEGPYEGTRIFEGVYEIGVDLEAGTYDFLVMSMIPPNYRDIRRGILRTYESMLAYRNGEDSIGYQEVDCTYGSTGGWHVRLEDGMVLKIDSQYTACTFLIVNRTPLG